MAVLKKGILGGFSGTVGTVVGSNWRGIDVIRSLPKSGSKAPSEKQLQQQQKFRKAVRFLAPLREWLSVYYGSPLGTQSRTNQATSHLLNEAMDLAAGMPAILWSKVLVSKGELTGFAGLTAEALPNAGLQLTWTDNSSQGQAAATDVLMVVAYHPAEEAFHLVDTARLRSAGNAEVQLPERWTGKGVQAYAFFRNAGKDAACNSVYLGALHLP